MAWSKRAFNLVFIRFAATLSLAYVSDIVVANDGMFLVGATLALFFRARPIMPIATRLADRGAAAYGILSLGLFESVLAVWMLKSGSWRLSFDGQPGSIARFAYLFLLGYCATSLVDLGRRHLPIFLMGDLDGSWKRLIKVGR